MENKKAPRMVTTRQAAKETGLSYKYILNLCKSNKIAHIKVAEYEESAGAFYVNMDKLTELLNNAGTGNNSDDLLH